MTQTPTTARLPRPRRVARSVMLACVMALGLLSQRGALSAQLTDPLSVQQQSTSDLSAAPTPSFGPGSSAPSSQTTPNTTQGSASTLGTSSLQGTQALPLSASALVRILEANPDIVVEVKSQVADRLQVQGTPVDPNDISDEMLYNQIATNVALRTSLTEYLRARGLISQEDLASSDVDPGLSSPFGNMTTSDTMGTQGANALAYSGMLPGGAYAPNATTARTTGRPLTDRAHETTHASTDLPKVLRQPTPYNLQSLRDLYTQIPAESATLKRFGSEVFTDRTTASLLRTPSTADATLAMPVGPDYVLGVGDTLNISLWGGVTQSLTRVIENDGHVLLPEAGSVQVAGLPLGRAETLIGDALKRQYRNVQVAVTASRLHSVRVYVVGDVQRPGGYDISSLATSLSALVAAGGPTAAGSLRVAHHYRGQRLIEDVDLYTFLIHGMQTASSRFESGDTLLVPPAGPQVALSGAVRRPAIYELLPGESSLASALDDAGGLTASASLGNVTIDRIAANRKRETITVDHANDSTSAQSRAALEHFAVQDGDRIYIAPILPYSERSIYLEGHVVRSGRLPYRDGMKLTDVLRSYQDMLPEPAAKGEIVRLIAPDLHAETLSFNLPDVLIGNANISLEPFDTIRIFGRYEVDAPKVMVNGEVLRPGMYPLSDGMTAAQLVRMAGGFKRDALLESADLTSYRIDQGNRIEGKPSTIAIGAAVAAPSSNADVVLKPGDVLTIRQITGWNDIGQSIEVEGQVRFPGNYGFTEGEHLSSLLRRAGGLRDTAYPEGAVLIRAQVRELEEKSREELIKEIETTGAAARLSPGLGTGDASGTLQLIRAQQDQALAQLQAHPPSGRMVIHVTADINSWAGTDADIELRRGDVLTIPKRPGFVLVTGQVYNATALTFAPGKTADWYLSHAGGTNSTANRKEIFIIRANGSILGRRSGAWFDSTVLTTKLDPGDVIVVPQKIIGSSVFWRNLLITAQLASSIAITAGIAVAAL